MDLADQVETGKWNCGELVETTTDRFAALAFPCAPVVIFIVVCFFLKHKLGDIQAVLAVASLIPFWEPCTKAWSHWPSCTRWGNHDHYHCHHHHQQQHNHFHWHHDSCLATIWWFEIDFTPDCWRNCFNCGSAQVRPFFNNVLSNLPTSQPFNFQPSNLPTSQLSTSQPPTSQSLHQNTPFEPNPHPCALYAS